MDAESPPPARARLGIGAGAGIVIVLAVLVVAVLVSALAPRGSSEVLVTNPGANTSDSIPDSTGAPGVDDDGRASAPVIFVHVLGQVGLALGDDSLVDASRDQAMKGSGLSHLTAVSGAN